tara:strand:+ start:5432 stop:5758 length:327 start_codon:yes stop_codon:yes gene_type:complete
MKIIDTFINEGDILIRENNIDELYNLFQYLLHQEEYTMNLEYLFQKLFLKSIIYGNKDTIMLFINIYNNHMNQLSKKSQLPTIKYAKTLIKKRQKSLAQWYCAIADKL